MEIISKGKENKRYRVICPICHSILEGEDWEFIHYEGMYDEDLVSPRYPCPNCKKSFSILKSDFKKCVVEKLEEEKEDKIIYTSSPWMNKVKELFKFTLKRF